MKDKTLIGKISINSKGVGFFDIEPKDKQGQPLKASSGRMTKPDRDESIEIQPENINRAFHDDIVEIALTGEKIEPQKNGRGGMGGKKGIDRPQGKVLRVVERAKKEYVGTITKQDQKTFVVPDDKRMYVDIFLSDSPKNAQNKIPVGTKVLVRVDWNKSDKNLVGEVVKIIGTAGENNTEMEAIVLEKGFRVEFPTSVETEALEWKKKYPGTFEEEIKKRRDMRGVTTMTIDPADAKDFDDAISFADLGNTGKNGEHLYEIGVHIADVSYFVTPGTALDREAEKRGLSVYLVDRTIPMLPEVLSNDLCSLNPKEDKYTFSAVFKMNDQGEVSDEWFGRTIIHSDRRFTYEDAQDVIDGKTDGPFQVELRTLQKIAKVMEKRKFGEGAINFETEEVKFVLDATGKPISVYKKPRLDTHKLVEEYMLLANRAVAKYIFMSQNEDIRKKGSQSVYRIHARPDKDRIQNLATFLKALGFDLKNKDGAVTSRDINALLKQVEGTKNEELIKTATIRSMAKAVYSTKNIGHFGLAFAYYTHFTSPIRRYPDLMVHRFLERELKGGKIEQNEFEKYERICLESSENEKRASDAERASIKYKQVEYMSSRVGDVFHGVITGVTEWGIYIEEKETKCEGMVKIRDLKPDDYYTLDEKNYTIKGEKTGTKLTLGDAVTFKVVSADMDKRVLDYALV